MLTMLEAIGEHEISLNWEDNNFYCYLVGDGDCDDGDGGVMEMMILTKMEMVIV